MNDWLRVKQKNEDKLNRLNLPNFKSNSKVFILDKYCPYSLDGIVNIQPVIDTEDLGIHGSWVAQVIKLIAGENVEFYGSGFTGLDEIVDYCIETNIRVVNSSITCFYSSKYEEALKRYADWGGIWIASAGNDNGHDVKYPGRSEYTICVSATNSEDCDGEEIDITTDSNWYLRSLKDGYFTVFNGTSCSAPVIAGCIRLILDARPDWKLEDVKQFLKENSVTNLDSLEKYERFFSFPDNFTKELSWIEKLKSRLPDNEWIIEAEFEGGLYRIARDDSGKIRVYNMNGMEVVE